MQTAVRREPTARSERGPAHQPGRPDVGVDTAFVAHAVADAGVRKEGVVLLAVLLRHVAADVGDLLLDVRGHAGLVDRRADGSQEDVGQLERVVVGDVEPVQQPETGELEVVVQRPAGRGGLAPQALEQGSGVLVRVEGLARGRVGPVRRDQGRVLGRAAAGDQGRAAHQTEQLHRRQTGPLRCVDEEVARGDHRGAGERHVLPDHRGVVGAAAAQVVHQLLVAQRIGIHRLDLVVGLHGGRLADLVPLLRLVAPQPALEHVRGALDAVGEGLGRHRDHLPVGEPVGVGGHPGLERDAVERHHVAVPEAERRRVHLGPVGGHRAGEVHRVEVPGTGSRRLEGERLLGRGVHRGPFSTREDLSLGSRNIPHKSSRRPEVPPRHLVAAAPQRAAVAWIRRAPSPSGRRTRPARWRRSPAATSPRRSGRSREPPDDPATDLMYSACASCICFACSS